MSTLPDVLDARDELDELNEDSAKNRKGVNKRSLIETPSARIGRSDLPPFIQGSLLSNLLIEAGCNQEEASNEKRTAITLRIFLKELDPSCKNSAITIKAMDTSIGGYMFIAKLRGPNGETQELATGKTLIYEEATGTQANVRNMLGNIKFWLNRNIADKHVSAEVYKNCAQFLFTILQKNELYRSDEVVKQGDLRNVINNIQALSPNAQFTPHPRATVSVPVPDPASRIQPSSRDRVADLLRPA